MEGQRSLHKVWRDIDVVLQDGHYATCSHPQTNVTTVSEEIFHLFLARGSLARQIHMRAQEQAAHDTDTAYLSLE